MKTVILETDDSVIPVESVTDAYAEDKIVVLQSDYGDIAILTRNCISNYDPETGSQAKLFFTPIKFSNDGGGHWDGNNARNVKSFIQTFSVKDFAGRVLIFDNYMEFGEFLSNL